MLYLQWNSHLENINWWVNHCYTVVPMHGLLFYSMELLLLGKLCMLWQAFFTDPIINYLPSIYCIAGVCRAKFSQQARFNPRNLIRSCQLCIHQADHAQAHEYKATLCVSIGVPEPCQMPAQEFTVQNFTFLFFPPSSSYVIWTHSVAWTAPGLTEEDSTPPMDLVAVLMK